MNKNTIDSSTREPYEAPSIEDVPLRPEEQLLAGCKQPAGQGPASIFAGCGPPQPCKFSSPS